MGVHPAATNSRIKATKCFISSLRGCANEPCALIDNTRLCCDGRCRRTFPFPSDRRSSPPTARRHQTSQEDRLFTSRPATAACSLLRALLLRLRLLVQAQVRVRPLRPRPSTMGSGKYPQDRPHQHHCRKEKSSPRWSRCSSLCPLPSLKKHRARKYSGSAKGGDTAAAQHAPHSTHPARPCGAAESNRQRCGIHATRHFDSPCLGTSHERTRRMCT